MSFSNEIGPTIITLLVSLLLIVCHFIYNNKNKFSLFNRTMPDKNQTQEQAKQAQTQVKEQPIKPLKIVVFDLDETLGCFIEVGIFWDALEDYYGHNLLFYIQILYIKWITQNIQLNHYAIL